MYSLILRQIGVTNAAGEVVGYAATAPVPSPPNPQDNRWTESRLTEPWAEFRERRRKERQHG